MSPTAQVDRSNGVSCSSRHSNQVDGNTYELHSIFFLTNCSQFLLYCHFGQRGKANDQSCGQKRFWSLKFEVKSSSRVNLRGELWFVKTKISFKIIWLNKENLRDQFQRWKCLFLPVYDTIIHATLPLPAWLSVTDGNSFRFCRINTCCCDFQVLLISQTLSKLPGCSFSHDSILVFYIIQNSCRMTSAKRYRSIPENLFVLV